MNKKNVIPTFVTSRYDILLIIRYKKIRNHILRLKFVKSLKRIQKCAKILAMTEKNCPEWF